MPGMSGNNTATLMTSVPQQPKSQYKCLKFWYHMFGSDPANFSLSITNDVYPFVGQVLWMKRQPQSNNWIEAQINIPPVEKAYNLMFKASLVANSDDNIGLDDISFIDGYCPQQQINDFEVNTVFIEYFSKSNSLK